MSCGGAWATGTVIDTVYREGMHVILPINKMYIYNMRKQQFNETIDVLTLDGLTVKVKYTARYYLEKDTLPLLHQRVGPDYVNVVVRPDVRSVIRTWFGQYKPEEIYTSQKAIQLRVSEQSKIRLAARFVTLDDVLIESITLPTRISEAIESKLAQQQREGEYVYRLSIAQKEAERLRIESAGIQLYNDTVNRSLTPSVLKWHGIQGDAGVGEIAERQDRGDRCGQFGPAAHSGKGLRHEEAALLRGGNRIAHIHRVAPVGITRKHGKTPIRRAEPPCEGGSGGGVLALFCEPGRDGGWSSTGSG